MNAPPPVKPVKPSHRLTATLGEKSIWNRSRAEKEQFFRIRSLPKQGLPDTRVLFTPDTERRSADVELSMNELPEALTKKLKPGELDKQLNQKTTWEHTFYTPDPTRSQVYNNAKRLIMFSLAIIGMARTPYTFSSQRAEELFKLEG